MNRLSAILLCALCSISVLAQTPKMVSLPKGKAMSLVIAPVVVTNYLVWDKYTNIWLQIESTTNLSTTNWLIESKLYMPCRWQYTNNTVQKFYRLGIQETDCGRVINLSKSNTITNN